MMVAIPEVSIATVPQARAAPAILAPLHTHCTPPDDISAMRADIQQLLEIIAALSCSGHATILMAIIPTDIDAAVAPMATTPAKPIFDHQCRTNTLLVS